MTTILVAVHQDYNFFAFKMFLIKLIKDNGTFIFKKNSENSDEITFVWETRNFKKIFLRYNAGEPIFFSC